MKIEDMKIEDNLLEKEIKMLRKDGFLVLVSLVLSAVSANAAIITIEVTAEISQVNDYKNYFDGNIQVGDQLVLTYSYDSETSDSRSEDYRGKYIQSSPCGVFTTIGNYIFQSDQDYLDYHIGVELDQSKHSYYMVSIGNLMPEGIEEAYYYILWQLEDGTATALQDDSLPLAAPNLENWTYAGVEIYTKTGLNITADTISVSVIPEPFSIILLGIGGLFLRRRF